MTKLKQQSLHKRENQLANPNRQLEILNGGIFENGELPTFAKIITQTNQFPLRPKKLEILQINVGYMCNQVCEHCHVDAGPDRKEIMTWETMQKCLEIIKNTGAHTLDLTGGAPEMNPNFRRFVEKASQAGVKDFIVRSNLTFEAIRDSLNKKLCMKSMNMLKAIINFKIHQSLFKYCFTL